jgi:hypothetical protein
VNTVILVLLVLTAWEERDMALGEIWIELAKQRAEDLREEGRRVGRGRRTQLADGRTLSALHARTEQLVHWFQHGQIGTGIDDLPDGPVTARGRCA